MAGMPSESELEIALREILRVVNVEEASLKIIRQKLEARFEVCVFPKLSADRVLESPGEAREARENARDWGTQQSGDK